MKKQHRKAFITTMTHDTERQIQDIRDLLSSLIVLANDIHFAANRIRDIAYTPQQSDGSTAINHAVNDGMAALIEEAEDNGLYHDIDKLQRELLRVTNALDAVGKPPTPPSPGQLPLLPSDCQRCGKALPTGTDVGDICTKCQRDILNNPSEYEHL